MGFRFWGLGLGLGFFRGCRASEDFRSLLVLGLFGYFYCTGLGNCRSPLEISLVSGLHTCRHIHTHIHMRLGGCRASTVGQRSSPETDIKVPGRTLRLVFGILPIVIPNIYKPYILLYRYFGPFGCGQGKSKRRRWSYVAPPL